ncbi:hypothetical protein [Leptolyngbya sp. FACHB-16]|uniref:hypothetical protein n=1 Tax=unclassified Leptolyngbya TaxID=2650499 RepID=UPI001685BA02|nr:hypothetical protein [Leptolyngbya sp. FACHB-16]MBD2152938.1 hypothetical protein [Leptolyngbya sp. FACHB-16]
MLYSLFLSRLAAECEADRLHGLGCGWFAVRPVRQRASGRVRRLGRAGCAVRWVLVLWF